MQSRIRKRNKINSSLWWESLAKKVCFEPRAKKKDLRKAEVMMMKIKWHE